MRKTLFLVPRGDAVRVLTAVRPSPAEVERSLKRHDLSREDYERIADRVLGAAQSPNPVVLVDGEVAGLWTYTHKAGAHVEPFDAFGPRIRCRVDEKLEAIAGLLTR